jgi:hypothetical protein
MKIQKTVAALAILGGTGVLAFGQTGLGKHYDTRDPFVCKSKKEPAKGAPSASQAKDLVLCTNEKAAGGYIGLFQNMQVEIGTSRPYSAWSDSGNSSIDNSQPVYPIRGSAEFYSCRPPGSMGSPAGQNCQVTKGYTFKGTCFKTTFGDWSCPIQGTSEPFAGIQSNMPPPK